VKHLLRSPMAVGMLVLAMVLVAVQLTSTPQQLGFIQALVTQQHDYYRLASAQFIHLNWSHLANNLVGLAVIGVLFSPHVRTVPALLIRVVVLALAVAIAVWWLAPDVQRFLGFSAVLYALFAWGALLDVLTKRLLGWVLLLLVVGKTSYEFITGNTWISLSAASQIGYSAHFFGMVAGILLACFDYKKGR